MKLFNPRNRATAASMRAIRSPAISIVIALASAHASADTVFFDTPLFLGAGENPYAATVATIGGKISLITTEQNSSRNSIITINPDGTYNAPAFLVTATNPHGVAAGTLDLIGGYDGIATTSFSPGSGVVDIKVRQPNGTYVTQGRPVGMQPVGVILARITNASYPDVVTANFGSNTVSIVPNLGGGQFGIPSSVIHVPTGLGPIAVARGNFNGDSFTDLVVANNLAGTVSILLGAGGGTFAQRPPVVSGSGSNSFPSAVAARDFDGNGYDDFVVTNSGDSTISVFLNDPNASGSGLFLAPVQYPTGTNPVAVVASQFTTEPNRIDIVVANFAHSTLTVFAGRGDGTFRRQSRDLAIGGDGPGLTGLASGYLGGDLLEDLLIAKNNSFAGVLVNLSADHILTDGFD